MAIVPKCYACHHELREFGGILLGLPFPISAERDAVSKDHLCPKCFKRVEEFIDELRAEAAQKVPTKDRDPDMPVDIVLVGIIKTTKTHLRRELEQEGFLTSTLVFDDSLDQEFSVPEGAFVIGLKKDPGLIQLVRQQSTAHGESVPWGFLDRDVIATQQAAFERFCSAHAWPVMDVTGLPYKESTKRIIERYKQWAKTQAACAK